jgi:RHS repeat-associated protein
MWYRYRYDANGRCVQARGAGGHLDYDFEYDRDKLITVVTNSFGYRWRFQLDEGLRVIAETDPFGNTTVSEWADDGQLLARTDRLGNTTRWEYDAHGRQIRLTYPDGTQTRTEHDERGWPVATIRPDGTAWRHVHTPGGALAQEIDPIGATTTYGYDEAGNLVTITDPLGNTTRHAINTNGRITRTTTPVGARTEYGYDQFGRMSQVVGPTGEVTRTTWTAEGRVSAETLPDGSIQRWRYDGEGNERQAVDAQGLASSTEIGYFDLPIAQIASDGSRLSFRYDTELRLTGITNEQGLTWRMAYDAVGNLMEETDFDGRMTRYARDSEGNVTKRVNPAGQIVRLTRDPRGRVVRSDADGEVTTFEYDPVGRLLRAIGPDADLRIVYDDAGRMTSETINGRTISFSYDLAGRRIGRRTPTGAVSTWDYDADDLPVALHVGDRTVRFGYDPAGREVRRRMGTVLLTQRWQTEDQLAGQTLVSDPGHDGEVLLGSRRFGYHANGLLASVTGRPRETREFDVDQIGRITAVRRPGSDERYDYDPAGNIVDASWQPPQRANSGVAITGERVYHGTALSRAGATTYEHDECGRRITHSVPNSSGGRDVWHYSWDAYDQLVAVHTPDGQHWRYRYDPLGRRISKQRIDIDGGVLEQIDFTWDGEYLVEQVHNNRQALVWEWESQTHRALSQTLRLVAPAAAAGWVDEQFHPIVADLVGTPTELVDPDGTVAWQLDLTLWGVLLSSPGTAYTPLRFPGQYHDPETGLHYNHNRYYDPTTGRYLSIDPLGLQLSANPLAYVANPTALTDPLGLGPVCKNSTATTKSSSSNTAKQNLLGTPKVTKGKQPGGKYGLGSHGNKKQEQKRLTAEHNFKVHGASGGGKTGKPRIDATHESEHSIPFEVLREGDEAKRGETTDLKEKENRAGAYQEMAPYHRNHPGTGNRTEAQNSGWNSKGYRNDLHTSLQETNSPNTAVQLNQLGYAHLHTKEPDYKMPTLTDADGNPIKDGNSNAKLPDFQTASGTKEGQVARDSYDHHVEHMRGAEYNRKDVDPNTGETTYTPTKTADPTPQDKAEMFLARRTAESGQWPTTDEENAARAKFGVDPIKDPDAMDVDE